VNARKKKYLIVLVSVLYLSTSLYLELGHTDILEGNFGAIQRLFSHDCNGKEVHRPLGGDDRCPICVRSSQTIAYVESNVYFPPPSFELIGSCTIRNSFPYRERTASAVRGPPTPSV
jgi:hypothetical protein